MFPTPVKAGSRSNDRCEFKPKYFKKVKHEKNVLNFKKSKKDPSFKLRFTYYVRFMTGFAVFIATNAVWVIFAYSDLLFYYLIII
jgi:hypothetical protein